jgi:ABC-type glutathione transport system ATPase component
VARRHKSLTRAQLEARKAQAARFTRDVVGDPDRASEIEAESLEDYAARRHIVIQNPRSAMPRKTIEDYRTELKEAKEHVRDLEQENESLQEQLDQISDIVAPEPDEDEDEDEEDEDGDEDDDNPIPA